MKFRITFARHGETEENHNAILQGHYNSRLNQRGEKQAESLGQALASECFTRVYSSDLHRAKRTCDIAMAANENFKMCLGEMNVDTRLRERCFGVYENRPKADFLAKCAKHSDFRPEGGETYGEVKDRAVRFFSELSSGVYNNTKRSHPSADSDSDDSDYEEKQVQKDEQSKSHNFFIVTHGFFLNVLFRQFSAVYGCQHQGEDLTTRLANASRSCFEVSIPERFLQSGVSFSSLPKKLGVQWRDGITIKCVYYNVTDY